ncbi:MAG: c-type cytochrome [Gammaproteobacteria bacterium]
MRASRLKVALASAWTSAWTSVWTSAWAFALLAGISAPGWAVPVAQQEFGFVLKRTPDAAHGAVLYETCAACHGKNGAGVNDGTVPALAGQSFNVIAKQLVDFRAGVRGDARMAHFSDTRHLAFSQHIADVAAYIAALPSPARNAVPDGQDPKRGQPVYARLCARCHGASAEGNENTLAPRLASQHFDYLIRQLDDATQGRRSTMESSHTSLVSSLPREDITAVAAFLTSLPK